MKKFFLVMAASLLTLIVQAVPAIPTPFNFTQSDGTTITVTMVGDEWGHLFLTTDGLTVNRASDTSDFFYATSSGISQMRAHNVGQRSEAEQVFVAVNAAALSPQVAASEFAARRARANERRKAGTQVPQQGSPRIPIILVNYSDVKFSDADPTATYESQFNTKAKSCLKYFTDMSRGKFTPQFDILGPVTLDKNRAYYGGDDPNNSSNHDMKIGSMVAEAVKALPDVNFSLYDNDKDGMVDVTIILFAGVGQASSGVSESIWPCQWDLYSAYYYGKSDYSYFSQGGAYINKFAVFNELAIQNRQYRIGGIGTFCHEFSHCLGLPDYYETTYANGYYGMGYWSLMNSGCYLDNEDTPCGYSAYDRNFMGWMNLITPDENTQYTLDPLTSESGQAVKIVNNESADEYYILENRQKTGWDQYLAASGLKVDHVTYSASAWSGNTVNNEATQRMTIIPADGVLSRYSESGDLYPYNGNNSLTDESTPAATLNNGSTGLMGKPVTSITKESNGQVSFWYCRDVFIMDTPEMQDIDLSTVTDSTFSVTWTSVKNVASYTLNIQSAASNTSALNRDITGLTATIHEVTDLEPGGTYQAKVKVIYTNGQESDWSNVVTLTLPERPILNETDPASVTANAFTASWKPLKNHNASYTLSVFQEGVPAYKQLLEETFAKCTKNSTTNIRTTINNYTDNDGWSGGTSSSMRIFEAEGGVKLGNDTYLGTLYSPELDINTYAGEVTVKISVATPNIRYTDCPLQISVDGDTTVIVAESSEEQTFIVSLTGNVNAASQKLCLKNTTKTKPVVVKSVTIYAGDASSVASQAAKRAPIEFGDAVIRTISDITEANSYTVSGLEAGKTYLYKVKGFDAQGNATPWSDVKTVTLTAASSLKGDVNGDGKVDIADINALVSIILGNSSPSDYSGNPDVNGDNGINVADVNALVSIILAGA